MESIADNIAFRNLDFSWKKKKQRMLFTTINFNWMTSDNSFAVLFDPLTFRDRNSYVLKLPVNYTSISHYEEEE